MASNKDNKAKSGKSETLSFTAQTLLIDMSYLDTKKSLYHVLDDIGDSYGHIKRSLFKDSIRSGNKPISFKNEYLVKYGITAQQFNAIRYDLDGNISSAVEILKLRVVKLEQKIKSVRKWIRTKENNVIDIRKDEKLSGHEKTPRVKSLRFAVHNKKRKLHSSVQKLEKLKYDLDKGRIRICFGTKKTSLFPCLQLSCLYHHELCIMKQELVLLSVMRRNE